MVIAGVTTRAFAGSAARAGYRVTAVDGFGDLDLRALADVIALTRESGGFTPGAAADAARRVTAGLAAYTSNFENHPDAVAELAAGRRLLGNSPAVLRAVRDPLALMRTLSSRGFPTPLTRASAPRAARAGAWLLKPRRSGGGHGTRPWRPGYSVPRSAYLQQRIPGVPGSIVFLADGRRIFPLGLTRQLVGERGFGATGYRYCGSLLGSARAPLFHDEPSLREAARGLAEAVTDAFGLVGLNGIDFIAQGGVPWPIEVNPRPCASMELVERAGSPPLFALHAPACDGRLPAGGARFPEPRGVAGKAVVFARRTVTVGRFPRGLLGSAADVPHPGERFDRGQPICTLYSEGEDGGACLRNLAARAQTLYAALEPSEARIEAGVAAV
ncbi:MAG: ATP-grasp domain-containing protein [Gemmatimonadales bacterium]|nr:ATP-grasp domain-containing protein [Gemmatimonadales bacterium]